MIIENPRTKWRFIAGTIIELIQWWIFVQAVGVFGIQRPRHWRMQTLCLVLEAPRLPHRQGPGFANADATDRERVDDVDRSTTWFNTENSCYPRYMGLWPGNLIMMWHVSLLLSFPMSLCLRNWHCTVASKRSVAKIDLVASVDGQTAKERNARLLESISCIDTLVIGMCRIVLTAICAKRMSSRIGCLDFSTAACANFASASASWGNVTNVVELHVSWPSCKHNAGWWYYFC